MSMVLPVTRINPQNMQAIMMDHGPQGRVAGIIQALLVELDVAGYRTESKTGAEFPGNWRIILSRGNDADQMAYPDDWILVTDAEYTTVDGWKLQSVSRAYVYGISIGLPGTAVDFVNIYTADVPFVWEPETVPPTLVAQSELKAALSFKQPTSPNGPFTYSVELTDVTTNDKTQLELPWEVDPAGLVTITISELTDAHQYTATVTVTANPAYTDTAPLTSVASNEITASYVVEAPVEAVASQFPPMMGRSMMNPPLSPGAQVPIPISTVPIPNQFTGGPS